MKKTSKIIAAFLTLIMVLSPVAMTAQAATKSQIVDEILSVAAGEVGYTASSSYSKYGAWYGWQGPWCTSFVLWVYNKAGENLGVSLYNRPYPKENIIPNGGDCNSMISWFQNRGRYHSRSSGYKPQPGDFVFFDWSGNGSAQHVGIVRYTSGSSVYTVEGNNQSQVRNRTYVPGGAAYCGRLSSIMGYGNPNFSIVANGSSSVKKTTNATKKKKKSKKKKTTTTQYYTTKAKKKKKSSKKKKSTTTAYTTQQTTQDSNEELEETTSTTVSTTAKKKKKKVTTTMPVVAQKMNVHVATTDLEVGDSVQLDYAIEPSGANAVVGYFCDEENIVEINDGGEIKAVGEGKATVVVCANDEIYKHVDFVVSAASMDVTKQKTKNDYKIIENETSYVPTTQKTADHKLKELGVNMDQLTANKDYYILPLGIAGITALLGLSIVGIKKLAKSIKNKKAKKEENSEEE